MKLAIYSIIIVLIFTSRSGYSQVDSEKENQPGIRKSTYEFSAGFIWSLNYTGLSGYEATKFRGPNIVNLGAVFQLKRDELMFEIDVIILETGVRFDGSSQILASLGNDRQVNTNLMFPFFAGYRFGSSNEIVPFIKGGFYVSRLLKATYKIPGPFLIATGTERINNIDEFNRWDFGISLSTGLEFEPGSIEFRANWGLRDLNRNPDDIWQYVDTSNPIRSTIYQVALVANF